MGRSIAVRRPSAAAPGQAGFTLLELLVALALVALISVVLMGGIRFGARVWDASQVRTEAANEIIAIRRFVRERALAARPVRMIGNETGEKVNGFFGDTSSLQLVTLMPSYVARGGLYHFELAAADSDGHTAIAAKWWPYGGVEAGPGSGQRRLLNGVENIRISYFGASNNSEASAWHDEWHDPRELPRLISVKVTFPTDDPRVWPELIVALPASNGRSNARTRN